MTDLTDLTDPRDRADRGIPRETRAPGRDDLEAVCRAVDRIARTAAGPPRRVRLRCGDASVDVEWPDAATGPGRETPTQEPVGGRDDTTHYVRAPMVGTFYHAADPAAPPYVGVGDVVRAGQEVGLLEVMKMMNPVTSDIAGRVVEILVPNAHPVEFEQRLLAIEPLGEGGAP